MNGSGESAAGALAPAVASPHAAAAVCTSTAGAVAAGSAAAAAAPLTVSTAAAAAPANPVVAAAAALPLVQLLQQSLSADPAVLRVAGEALDIRAAAEDFLKELLLVLINADTPPAAKQAGAIYFKNFVRRHWDVEPQQGGISVGNRLLIKQHLLSLLLAPAAARAVQVQLADACTRIAATDMPLDWPSLLPELMQQHLLPSLSTQQQLLQRQRELRTQEEQLLAELRQQQQQEQQQDVAALLQRRQEVQQLLLQQRGMQRQELQKEVAVLGMLHAVLKKYRTAFRCNEVLLELKEVLPAVQQPLLQAFMLAGEQLQLLQLLGGDAEEEQQLQKTHKRKGLLCDVLLLCCKTFFSLNTVDIPEFFEDHMREFFNGFIRLLLMNDVSPCSREGREGEEAEEEDDPAGRGMQLLEEEKRRRRRDNNPLQHKKQKDAQKLQQKWEQKRNQRREEQEKQQSQQ